MLRKHLEKINAIYQEYSDLLWKYGNPTRELRETMLTVIGNEHMGLSSIFRRMGEEFDAVCKTDSDFQWDVLAEDIYVNMHLHEWLTFLDREDLEFSDCVRCECSMQDCTKSAKCKEVHAILSVLGIPDVLEGYFALNEAPQGLEAIVNPATGGTMVLNLLGTDFICDKARGVSLMKTTAPDGTKELVKVKNTEDTFDIEKAACYLLLKSLLGKNAVPCVRYISNKLGDYAELYPGKKSKKKEVEKKEEKQVAEAPVDSSELLETESGAEDIFFDESEAMPMEETEGTN